MRRPSPKQVFSEGDGKTEASRRRARSSSFRGGLPSTKRAGESVRRKASAGRSAEVFRTGFATLPSEFGLMYRASLNTLLPEIIASRNFKLTLTPPLNADARYRRASSEFVRRSVAGVV